MCLDFVQDVAGNQNRAAFAVVFGEKFASSRDVRPDRGR